MPFKTQIVDEVDGGPGAVPRLDDADPDARRRAAHALAGQAEALPELVARLAVERDEPVRQALFEAVADVDAPAAVEALIPFLASDEADLRLDAVQALRRLPAHVAPRIEALLGDADSDVRLMALEIVPALAPPAPARALAGLLARETEVNVLAAALDRAGALGSADLIPAITATRARHPGDPFLLFCCDTALDAIAGAQP